MITALGILPMTARWNLTPPRTEQERVGGLLVATRYAVISPGERQDIVCVNPNATWDAALTGSNHSLGRF